MSNETINPKAVFSISYGLYCVTAADGEKMNGCIINTCAQVTSDPLRISVCINKANYTCEMLTKTKKFNVSVLTQSAPFELFERFGFHSGRDTDKFASFSDYELSANSLARLTKHCNAFFSADVLNEIDLGTHILFIADVTEAKTLSNDPSSTYAYYSENIKPKQQPTKKKGFVCKICGYIYEGDELPEDFVCPVCKHPASDFEPLP